MCSYDEHDTDTGIHVLIHILVCAWVFLDMFRKVTRVPKTYLSLVARTESKVVVLRNDMIVPPPTAHLAAPRTDCADSCITSQLEIKRVASL